MSFFKAPITSAYPARTVNLLDIYRMIKKENFVIIDKIRNENCKTTQKQLKASSLDFFTPCGTFGYRKSDKILNPCDQHVFDFDDVDDVKWLFNALVQDTDFQTNLAFISPSGQGIKWIIETPSTNYTHEQNYQAVSNYLTTTYGYAPDQSGKDIARACFLSHDPNIFINNFFLP